MDYVALVWGGFPYGGTAGFTISNNFANPGLKPEFTTSKEAGIILGFLRNRVYLEATYYNSLTTNQTVPTQISTATGFSSATINVGSMSNKGVELDLRMTPLVNLGPVAWNLGANFAYNKNRVGTDLPNELYIGNNVYATPGIAYPNMEVSDFARDPNTHSI